MKTLYKNTYDKDAVETQEWLDAYVQVLEQGGSSRGQWLLERLQGVLRDYSFHQPLTDVTPLLHGNTVRPSPVPSDIMDEDRQAYRAAIRWNAVAMVLRAQDKYPELGGHIATAMSIADIYAVAYEYFFEGRKGERLADCIFFQGHASPLMYARSYIEGRFDEEHLDHFRREAGGRGLSSYPHPQLMPDYWQFPTVSMGLGILQGIHTARILKYLDQRRLLALGDRRVWIYAGDGEMREPESISALSLASVDRLAHVTMVVNANLQGLDGLCRGNGSIIRELEGLFQGCGWRVIKLVWNQAWLDIFATDVTGTFAAWAASWVDGDHQNFYQQGPEYIMHHFLAAHPDREAWLVSQKHRLRDLLPGGHDYPLLYQAYKEAVDYTAGPGVILVQTIKGHGLPMASKNIAHQQKKLQEDERRAFAASCGIPFPEDVVQSMPYYRPERKILRRSLSPIPERSVSEQRLQLPDRADMVSALAALGTFSSTTSFVRVLSYLLRLQGIAPRLVPIVADEARTFGMEALFKSIGVYQATGAQFTSHDIESLTGYRDSADGQLLQEGINEAGAMASWLACATSYSVNDFPLIPFYIFYSMFGFQRVMDLIWAAADSRARGFLLGATAGRSTLAGEGLQHADGHSLLLADVVPGLVWYDPAYHAEVVVIMHYWLDQMLDKNADVIVYMTLVNEAVVQKSLPEGVEEDVIRGMYRFAATEENASLHLLGSGALLPVMTEVYEQLVAWGLSVALYSVTSYGRLRQTYADTDGHPVKRYLSDPEAVVVAVTDYVCLVPDMIRAYIPGDYTVCGTDGFGLSDTRASLRAYFSVDADALIARVLDRLVAHGRITAQEQSQWLQDRG